MSFQERRSIANMLSTVLITTVYTAYMLPRYPAASDYSPEVFHYWGSFFLILIPVSIAARIVIYIVFYILNAIATRQEEPDITDERDRLIELKADRNTGFVFGGGFLLAMIALVMSAPPSAMFLILLGGGVLSELVGETSRFLFYRRGV